MSFRISICYFLLLLYDVKGKTVEVNCPDYCTCDILEKLRRASCQQKQLVSVEIGMPSQVQVLDLSQNQISSLGNYIFLEIGLTQLQLLNLSHNKISQISIFGFEGLEGVKTLDLSFNSIGYFLAQWFVALGELQELYLRGNQLRSINHEPRISLSSLKVLDISQCGIESLHVGVLQNLPNLEHLDISGNYLIGLGVEIIQPLSSLTTLKANHNHFHCKHSAYSQLVNYAKKHSIKYEDSCKKRKRQEKFERMMVLEPQVPERNSWMYDEDEGKKPQVKVVEMCTGTGNNTNQTFANDVYTKHLLNVIDLSPWIFISITLAFGITLGIVIGCSCQITIDSRPPRSPDETLEDPEFFSSGLRRGSIRSIPSINIPAIGFQRQHSAPPNSFRPRTKSTGSRKVVREDRNMLLKNENEMSDSTPVLTRKMIV